jgi:hypothetical protein
MKVVMCIVDNVARAKIDEKGFEKLIFLTPLNISLKFLILDP